MRVMGLDVGSKTIGVAVSDELGMVGHPVATLARKGTRQDVQALAALQARLGEAVAIHEWDERFSTAAVERVLIEGDLSRRRRRQVVDQQAAAYILQGWLDARRPT